MKAMELHFKLDSIFKYAKKSILKQYIVGRISDLECIAYLEDIKELQLRCVRNAFRTPLGRFSKE